MYLFSTNYWLRFFAFFCAFVSIALFGACSSDDDPEGTNGDPPVTNVDDGMVWLSPVLLESEDMNVLDHDVAVDGSRNYIAVWSQNVAGSQEAVFAAKVTGSGAWSTAEKITVDMFSVADGPHIALNSGGLGLMAYGELSSYSSVEYTPGGGWSASAVEMNTGLIIGDSNLGLSTTGEGIFVAAAALDIMSQINSSGWGTVTYLEDTGDLAEEPSLGINSDGDAMAVWMQADKIRAAFKLGASTWETATDISGVQTDVENPDVAVSSTGDAIAVWKQGDGPYHVYAAYYTIAGDWSAAELISSNARAAGADPQVAFDSSGNAIAVWEENDGVNRTIYAARYTSAGGWGADGVIGNLSGEAHDPKIAMNGGGKAVVVWHQEEGSDQYIYSARYIPTEGAWMEAERVDEDVSSAGVDPKVAIHSGGSAVVVWRVDDGSYNNLRAARLE